MSRQSSVLDDHQPRPPGPGSITPDQNRYLHMLAHRRGMDVDDIRAMTPERCKNSIRALSKAEASILIDALKHGKRPDYSQLPRGYHKRPAKPRPPRLAQGVARQPTLEALEMDRSLVEWLAQHYGKRVRDIEEWLKTKHYSHGGPMHIILTSTDCVERIELMKAVKAKAIAAAQRRQRSAASEPAA